MPEELLQAIILVVQGSLKKCSLNVTASYIRQVYTSCGILRYQCKIASRVIYEVIDKSKRDLNTNYCHDVTIRESNDNILYFISYIELLLVKKIWFIFLIQECLFKIYSN